MHLTECDNYKSYVQFLVYDAGRNWGGVKKLAARLQCHSSFVSQVAKGDSHFSQEQALAFCEFFQLQEVETECFVDLVQYCRAGDERTREFWTKRLQHSRTKLQDLSAKLRPDVRHLNAFEENEYYRSWLPSALHMVIQTPGDHTAESLAGQFALPREDVDSYLKDMVRMGLVKVAGKRVICLQDSVHLAKGSQAAHKGHVNWRQRTTQQLMTMRQTRGFHYSAVFTVAKKDVHALERLIREQLSPVRDGIIESSAEEVYVHCVDFYPLFP